MNGTLARRAVERAQQSRPGRERARGRWVPQRVAGMLAGLCCALSLGTALVACGAAPLGRTFGAANVPLSPRMVPVTASDTATAIANATATAAASATAAAPTATTAPATATTAPTATTAATATTGATATVATATTNTSTGPGTTATGDNGDFFAGVVLIATGALLLLLLVIGLAAYLLVWRKRSDPVLMERTGDTGQGGYGSGDGGYNGYNDYDGGYPAGPDEPTTPFGDYGDRAHRGAPSGWPDTMGGNDQSQWRGGAGGSRGGSQGGSRPPR